MVELVLSIVCWAYVVLVISVVTGSFVITLGCVAAPMALITGFLLLFHRSGGKRSAVSAMTTTSVCSCGILTILSFVFVATSDAGIKTVVSDRITKVIDPRKADLVFSFTGGRHVYVSTNRQLLETFNGIKSSPASKEGEFNLNMMLRSREVIGLAPRTSTLIMPSLDNPGYRHVYVAGQEAAYWIREEDLDTGLKSAWADKVKTPVDLALYAQKRAEMMYNVFGLEQDNQ